MIKKILILGLITLSLLIVSTINSVAVLGEKEDDLDDVYIEDIDTGELTYVSDKPNLDIKKVSYDRNGFTTTIVITVKGNIENKGDLEFFRVIYDLDYQMELFGDVETDEDAQAALVEYIFSLDWNLTAYSIIIDTYENYYEIYYVNEEVLIADSYSANLIDGTFSVNGDKLAITFDLLDDGDRLGNMTVSSTEFTGIDTSGFQDDLFVECEDTGSATKKDDMDTNVADGISSGVIALIVIIVLLIVGIATVTYFIRR